MDFKESETIEFKESATDGVLKEIIAFANCEGGRLYIGINDQGEIVGLRDSDAEALRISNALRDSVRPDITSFVRYKVQSSGGKEMLAIEVERGSDRPYYLTKKGLRPEGVFVRRGFSTVSASPTRIREMIKESGRDSYEESISRRQDLTFESAKEEFVGQGEKLESPQMRTLGIVSRDGRYTNLGLLLSDQCNQSIKLAVFGDEGQSIFKDRAELSGSLFHQLNDVYSFLDKHNALHSTFEGLYRIDEYDYPKAAIRECLLNCLVHKDYSYSSSTLISVYPDRMEFISLGGLALGITEDDLEMGVSVCRNPLLANVFFRLKLTEAYGAGLGKIRSSYEGSSVKPEIKITSHAFKVVLPNRHSYSSGREGPNEMRGPGDSSGKTPETARFRPDSPEMAILRFLVHNSVATRKDVQSLLQVSQSTAGRILRRLVEEEYLMMNGNTRSTSYSLGPKMKH